MTLGFVFEDRGYATPCRIWTGAKTADGYGTRKRSGRVVYVHREEWERARGPIPDGLCVCHRCDQPDCAEIEHLFLATHAENMRDAREKGRSPDPPRRAGAEHPRAVLSAEQVREIRAARGVTHRELAERFGVARATVTDVLIGRRWRELP